MATATVRRINLLAHAALLIVALLPLVAPVPTNVNIVITAAITVFAGCWRSVKAEPPAEAMTKKVMTDPEQLLTTGMPLFWNRILSHP